MNVVKWKIVPLSNLSNYCIEWIDNDGYILSDNTSLYHTSSLDNSLKLLLKFPSSVWKKHFTYIRPIKRLLRYMYYNVIKLPDGSLFISFDKRIRIFKDGRLYKIKGIENNFRILRSACAMDKRGNLFFGEYVNYKERSNINIYFH